MVFRLLPSDASNAFGQGSYLRILSDQCSVSIMKCKEQEGGCPRGWSPTRTELDLGSILVDANAAPHLQPQLEGPQPRRVIHALRRCSLCSYILFYLNFLPPTMFNDSLYHKSLTTSFFDTVPLVVASAKERIHSLNLK